VRGAILAGVVLSCACCACANAGKREAASLVDAVDHFRRADDATKATLAPSVDGVGCSAADVCEAKRACAAAIDPTARALALKSEVELRYADIERGTLDAHSPEASALAVKLDEATRLLQEGRARMPDCERLLTDLKARYGV